MYPIYRLKQSFDLIAFNQFRVNVNPRFFRSFSSAAVQGGIERLTLVFQQDRHVRSYGTHITDVGW